jgi:hypothetical protein
MANRDHLVLYSRMCEENIQLKGSVLQKPMGLKAGFSYQK